MTVEAGPAGVTRASTPDPDLAGALARTREARGLSRAALAHRCGISPTTLRGIEQAQIAPTWDTVRRLARGLDTGMVELSAAVEGRCPAGPRGERRASELLLVDLTAIRRVAGELGIAAPAVRRSPA